MVSSSQKTRAFRGPAIFRYGFRPFFFVASLWAVIAVLLWVLSYIFGDSLPYETDLVWHAHEMIFGYCSAVIAGFLLTAVPNWTGRAPILGGPLFGLVLLWIVGRVAMLMDVKPDWIALILDASFLVVFAGVISREVLAGKNRRNAKIAIILCLFALTNVGYHFFESFEFWSFDQQTSLGLGLVLLLIVIIGGRVTPSFTTNWLRGRSGLKPVPFGSFDKITIGISAISIFLWVFFSDQNVTGVSLLLAGGFNLVRLLRWKFWATFAEPLILILHIGYGWVIAAFFLNAGAILRPDVFPVISGIHAIGTGAIGVMTLAIMTRATLGHTGRELRADTATKLIFLLINLAAITRVLTPFVEANWVLYFTSGAALFWCFSFGIYAWVYGRYLWSPSL